MFSTLNRFINMLKISMIFLNLVALSLILFRKYILHIKDTSRSKPNVIRIGFFHPYCNAGGGGERVLWCAVRALQDEFGDKIHIKIFTGDNDVTPKNILQNAKKNFNFAFNEENIDFVYLKKRRWVEAQCYPYFTLLGQSLGSMALGIEALIKYQPDVYIDTMGYAFTMPIFRYIGNCKVGCYTHYPIINTEMLRRVKNRVLSHNNRSYVTKNPILTGIKLIYYRVFAKIYGWVGRSALTIMVNSSWTEKHIHDLWNVPFRVHRVYPPCEVSYLKKLQHIDTDKIIIMSVGQFRPEKDHPLQLQAMFELRSLLSKNEDLWDKLKLVIVGSCRNQEDHERRKNIEDLSKHLALENSVEIRHNMSYENLIEMYQTASIGLHTMWNEHFGIGVVECMAAGLITVSNNSGGPLMDIIETSEGCRTGYLATDAMEYANCIRTILYNTIEENEKIKEAARASCDRFSEEEFHIQFLRAATVLFNE